MVIVENIIFREFGAELIDEVVDIYEDNSWSAYTKDTKKLKRALDNSIYILGAFYKENLIGFVRCVGDGEHIIFIQDLILKPSYFRFGIGKRLYQLVSERFEDVRTLLLITDSSDQRANNFYKSLGLKSDMDGYPINTYFRQSNKEI